ncbi:MAG: hypothetical protein SFW09_22010 [Hyphomicrobiaceae bacterium]|nr:hypothetical protein [Hyphomicrobiaceae bacterium]
MLIRYAAALSLALLVSGCASEAPPISSFTTTSALAITTPTPAFASEAQATYRKTMSDRVLTAIALERVTGLKPDPARLVK